MMKFRRTLLGLAMPAVALGFTTGAQAQAAYKPEYKMSLVLGPPTPWGQAGKIWADLVKERTQGRINIKLYPGVSLIQGDQTREFSALRQGVIDMAEYKRWLVLGTPTPWGQAGKIWADLVKERTQGRINIKLYPGVSLIQGDQTREFSALRQGVIDM